MFVWVNGFAEAYVRLPTTGVTRVFVFRVFERRRLRMRNSGLTFCSVSLVKSFFCAVYKLLLNKTLF